MAMNVSPAKRAGHRFSSVNSALNPVFSRNCITVKYSSLPVLVNHDLLLGGKEDETYV